MERVIFQGQRAEKTVVDTQDGNLALVERGFVQFGVAAVGRNPGPVFGGDGLDEGGGGGEAGGLAEVGAGFGDEGEGRGAEAACGGWHGHGGLFFFLCIGGEESGLWLFAWDGLLGPVVFHLGGSMILLCVPIN